MAAGDITDRIGGARASLAYKAPVRAATTANITLSGEQTIDGISVVEDDRVLVKDQTAGAENGVYVAKATDWVRAKDWNGDEDIVTGSQVLVSVGTVNALRIYGVTTANPITIGTTAITFAVVNEFGSLTMSGPSTTVVDEIVLFNSTDGTLTKSATGSGLVVANSGVFTGPRTLTGTANQITATNGDGVSGNPTLSFPANVLIPTIITVPNTGLHLLDTDASHDLIVAPGSNLTADRTLTVTTGDASRTLTLNGNATLVAGTAATLTGSETLTNKTIALGSNTVSGTTAQFNTALTDGSFATLAGTEALTNKTFNAANNTLSLTTDSVDAITEIASGIKSGADATLITGTAGANGNLATWNADGDLVDGGGSGTAATQVQQEAATLTTVFASPGRQQFHPSACKAWIDISVSGGTPSIDTDYNVTSITDNAAGDFAINWDTDFSSADYAVNATSTTFHHRVQQATAAVGTVDIQTFDNSHVLADPVELKVAAWGDQ